MERACVSCGASFEAKSPRAKLCSPRCRQRAVRGHLAPAVAVDAALTAPAVARLSAAVLRELDAAGRTDSAAGQAALSLARRVESGADTGSGLASLVREMRASLAAATQGAKAELSPLDGMRDELAARRRA